ncbi:MAG: hypothetical protein RR630_02360 [Coprobacillus sp.]
MEKSEVKKNVLNITKIVAFLLIVAVSLAALSPIFKPKNNTKEAGIEYENARGFYGEKKNTIDVYAVGNSDLYSAFNPLQLWKEHGNTSYVSAEPQQNTVGAYYLLKEFLTVQKPKLVILEVDELFTKSDNDDIDDLISKTLRTSLPIFEYHSRWKDLSKDDFFNESFYEARQETKGYIYHNDVKPYKGSYMDKKRRKEMTYVSELYLDKFVKLARDNGAEVMFTVYPSATTWTKDKHETVKKYSKENKIKFVDFNVMKDSETGFNWSTDSRDGGNHLNFNGATKMTSYIGEYINQNYKLDDHRGNSEYSQWDKDYNSFMKKIKK